MTIHYTLFIFILVVCTYTLPGQDPLFTDITFTAGTGSGANNNGIIIGDFDNDGFEDLFVPARLSPNRLFKNMGDGTFSDITASAGIVTGGLSTTGAWGDIDNDGDLDLFIGNYFTATSPFRNYLYLNNGDGTFTDISVSANVGTFNQTRSVHMVDYNLDGFIDIYVCNLLQENILWRNNGNNTFTNTTFASGLSDTMISMGAIFFDYDNDGDQDAYLTHDDNQPYIMYENNGLGVFTDVSVETGLNVAGQGMGVDHGDINNDGHLDIYVTNLGPNFLLLNDGNGHFTEIAEAAGVADVGMGWGCFFVDYDNDGWEDIYVVNDSQFSPVSNKLYKNNGNNTFTIVSELSVLYSFYSGRGGTWADFNNDGYPEIIVANGQDFAGVQIFENQNSLHNWIGFKLEGSTDARDACGARIQLTTNTGVRIDEVTCGSSYAAMSSRRIYFGLGQGQATNISITWPNGTVDFFPTLAINEIHSIQQGMTAPDMDGDGYSNVVDCNDANPAISPGEPELPYNGIDDDCNPNTADDDVDGDGFMAALDCNDTNENVNPNTTELPYNGLDDDCNAATPDDDLDSDGFIAAADCNDANENVNPNTTELPYNGLDDDCDTITPDDDLDGDGFIAVLDCADLNENVNPNTTELPYNGLDDDCDAITPDDDLDGDGFIAASDCDDANENANPNTTEVPYNGLDDDCDANTPDDDLDSDGFIAALDCDDMNDNVNPNTTELPYNGLDDDCDANTPDDDLDGDGFVAASDCDDTNAAINEDAIEIANNGIDEDCDGEDLTVATHDVANESVRIFPNPVREQLYISVSQGLDYSVRLMDLRGRVLFAGVNCVRVEVGDFGAGVYVLEVGGLGMGWRVLERVVVAE